MRPVLLLALTLWLGLAGSAFADDGSSNTQPPSGPILQPSDNTPVICDPNDPRFRYVEVRGSGFDAWSTQHLVGALVDAGGTALERWNSVWVSPHGQLTVEVNLCGDSFQSHPALTAGDYTLLVGQSDGGTIASTGISLAAPPEPAADTGTDQAIPAGTSPPAQPTATPFTYVIPNVQAQPTPTPLPIASLASPTPTLGPRTGPGSLQQPYPLGAPGDLVDGWQLLVTGVTPDSYDGIKAEVPSAIAPAADQRDYMVRVQATYNGSGTGVFSGVRLALLSTATRQTYDQVINSCGVVPASLPPNVVTQGTAVRGNVCFTVRASDIGSLIAYDNQTSATDRVYFALQ